MDYNCFKIFRGVALAVVIMASANFAYSKELISRRYSAGYEYKLLSDEIETSNDISFELKDKKAEGKWDVLYLGYDGEYHSIYETGDCPERPESESNSIFFMRCSDDRFDPDIPRSSAKIYTDEDTPLHYIVKVTCEVSDPDTDNILTDTVVIRMGLPSSLPPVPEILSIKFENIVYNWEWDSLEDSELYIDLRCEGASVCRMKYNSQPSFVNSEDVFQNIYETIHLDNTYSAHFKFDKPEWGTIMQFSGFSEFGRGEYTERYFTTDYIDDPEILARIEELKNIANGLGDTKQVKIPISESISVTDEYVYCTGAISNLDLYDMNGNLLGSVKGAGLIRTDNFPHGVYMLYYTETDGSTHSRKILRN